MGGVHMVWLSDRERVTLAVLGALALAGFGARAWQQQRTPIRAVPGPTPPYAQWDAVVLEAAEVHLNRATADELERLPGVGPALAERILAYRKAHGRFGNVEELQQVPGIGPKTIEVLRRYLSIE